MAFVVEKDIALRPMNIRFLSRVLVMFDADGIAHLIKQLFGLRCSQIAHG
jgi:hypothetical protein